MIKQYCIIYEKHELVYGDFSYEVTEQVTEKTITIPAKGIPMAINYATEKLGIGFINEVFELE
jgi:hypothetical protein